jgi:asparagine synthetase B (glutamine-hydrolysing)
MCGIAGIVSLQQNWNYSSQQCTQFAEYNRFRGPDYYGEKLNTHNELKYFLAHHRL